MNRLLVFLLLSFLFAACADDDDSISIVDPDCGIPILITDTTDEPIGDRFDFNSISVTDRCLSISISTSGCGTAGWSAQFRTNGEVAESLPTQTNARFVFSDGTNGGASCLAYLTDTFQFDLSPYLDAGALPTLLTVAGPDTTLAVVRVE